MGIFKEKSDFALRFHDCAENDIFIRTLGYNDFNVIRPCYTTRRQHFYTVHLVLKGSGFLRLCGREYDVKEHSIFCVPPDTDLIYYPSDDDKWEYIWFEFTGKNSDLYLQNMGLNPENPVMLCRDFGGIYLSVYSIFSRYDCQDNVKYYDVLSLFYKIIAANSMSADNERPSIVQAAVSYIDCHYHYNNFTVESICSDLNISHAHLCRLFKASAGKTPVGYLLEVRIDEACRLLAGTNMHINEIAYSVGFKDNIHFLKTFKKRMECTPKEYRNKQKNNILY